MNLNATIPLSTLIAYVTLRAAIEYLFRARGLESNTSWLDGVVVFATGVAVLAFFTTFIAPVLFERRIQRSKDAAGCVCMLSNLKVNSWMKARRYGSTVSNGEVLWWLPRRSGPSGF